MASSDKVYTFADLNAHKTRESLWLTIGGNVYDVTAFLDEVMLEEAGRDGTEAFEDVGHSDEARADLKKLYIGKLDKAELGKNTTMATNGNGTASKAADTRGPVRFLLPIAVLVAWFAFRKFYA